MNTIGSSLIIFLSLLSLDLHASATTSEAKEKSTLFYPQFGISLPQPFTIGVEAYRIGAEDLRVFIDTGYIQLPQIGAVVIKEFSVNAGVRYYPWNNWFYTSGALGYRWLNFSTSSIGALKSADGEVLANTLAINFMSFYTAIAFGFNVYASSKINFGFEIGAQLPMMGSSSQEIELNSTKEVTGSDAFARIARFPIPQITLFRLSWILD